MFFTANQLTEKGLEHRHHEDKNAEYAYDKNGNLVKKIRHIDHNGRHDEITLYTYNYENQLIKVEIQQHHKQTIVSFTYDPFGRRLSKKVERDEIENEEHETHGRDCDRDDHRKPRTAYYVYDKQDIILEYNDHGRVAARYIHGLGIDEHLAVEKKADVYYYHADGLGSITALTDKKQHVVQRYKYDSFGNIIREREKIEQPYAFTGREWDEETGLYEYRARYYDSKTGRFNLQKDPIGIKGGINLYGAVGNNLISNKDPFGLLPNFGGGLFGTVGILAGGVSIEYEECCKNNTKYKRTLAKFAYGLGVGLELKVASGGPGGTIQVFGPEEQCKDYGWDSVEQMSCFSASWYLGVDLCDAGTRGGKIDTLNVNAGMGVATYSVKMRTIILKEVADGCCR